MYNEHGSAWAPNYDLVAWGLIGDYDPGQTMNYFTTSQFGLNNDYYWSNAQYDKLAVEQARAVDPQKRARLIWQMQQIMYQQSPNIILDYPDDLEAINTAKWTGWSQLFGGTGPAWQCEGNLTSYLDLRPAGAASTIEQQHDHSADRRGRRGRDRRRRHRVRASCGDGGGPWTKLERSSPHDSLEAVHP